MVSPSFGEPQNMKNTFSELSLRVRILFLLAVVLCIVNLPIFYVNSMKLQEDHKAISRGQEFRFAATHFLSAFNELEMLHKIYLLMPTPEKAAEFKESLNSVLGEMKNLNEWSNDNPARNQMLVGIEHRMSSRMATMKKSLQNRELQKSRSQAKGLISSKLDDDWIKIREKVDEINHDENLLLADSQRKIEEKNLNLRMLLLGLAMLDLGVLLFATLALRSEYNSKMEFGKKLNDLQVRYRTIVDNAPVIFWAVQKNERFSVFEGKGLDLAGFYQGEVVGQPYAEVFQDPVGILALKKALQAECVKQDIQIRGRWYETVYVPDLQQNKVCGVVGISLDITARKRGEEDAKKGNLAKSRFLANMSHEIRTPIGIISGFADLALAPSISDEEKTNFIMKIRKNSELLIDLVTDILDLSKIEAGKLETENREQDLHDFLRELHDIFNFKCQEKGISFLLEIGSPIPQKISTDPVRLRQILMNLLSNSLKFTREGFIRLSVTGSFLNDNSVNLQFFIEDSGIGMSADQTEKIFKPFSQVDSSMTRKYGGTGLGLALSKKLAGSLNGDLSLISSSLGHGSVFGFNTMCMVLSKERFDKIEFPSRNLKLAKVQDPRLQGLKVLLVEDSLDNQYLVKKILKAEGADVVVANDGSDGVEAASKGDFNVILMDIQMPKMDGFEATHLLREKGYKKPIIALTANALKEERERALHEGFNAYLTKPLHRQLLIRSLEESRLTTS